MKKSIIASLLCIALTFSLIPAEAITVKVNDNTINFDSSPVIENGRTLVPFRAIFEALGAEITWNDAAKTATGVKNGETVSVSIGKMEARVNGGIVTLDTAAKIIDDRTMVPVRFIAESFDCDVKWQSKTETVFITDEDNKPKRELSVHVIDVGQGDSILILLPNGEEMLIDAGDNGKGETVAEYLKGQNVGDIEYLVCTHPHADHIGGICDVISIFPFYKVFMPSQTASSKTYQKTMEAIERSRAEKIKAAKGFVIYDKNGLKIEILGPAGDKYSNVNNCSAVIKLTYINKAFLFMGDAEELAENEITSDVSSDVLKVGHHGSYTATGESFLRRVSPVYAVISAGKNNSYGHPHDIILERLKQYNISTFRTDINGTVRFISDGDSLEVKTAA